MIPHSAWCFPRRLKRKSEIHIFYLLWHSIRVLSCRAGRIDACLKRQSFGAQRVAISRCALMT
jgi:hypothetical protein